MGREADMLGGISVITLRLGLCYSNSTGVRIQGRSGSVVWWGRRTAGLTKGGWA
jgi:hypothetical protein